MNEMIQSPMQTQPAPTPAIEIPGCLMFTEVKLQTPNGVFDVGTAVYDTVRFMAAHGVEDSTKLPPFVVVCCSIKAGNLMGERHWQSCYSSDSQDAQRLMFAPGDWCSGCKALMAMPPVAPALPFVTDAPVIVPAGSQLALEHTQHGNGAQTATAHVAPDPSAPAVVTVALPVLTEADLANIMQAHFTLKQEITRITAELEAAKVAAVEPFRPLLDRGIKKLTYQGVKYSLVQKVGQLAYLRSDK